MNSQQLHTLIVFCLSMAVACGSPSKENSENSASNGDENSQNSDTNNGSTNNAATNAGSNNVTPNSETNGQTNNASTNGQTNNASTNSQTNSQTNSMTNNSTGGDYDELVQAQWEAFCEVMFECPDEPVVGNVLGFYGGRYETEAECKANLHPGIVDHVARQSFEEGRITISQQQLSECVEAVGKLCDGETDQALSGACEPQGTVAQGGECIDDDDCVGNLDCDVGDMMCAGSCEPSCYGTECADDEYCDNGAQACMARVGEGEDCDFNVACADGLFCQYPDDDTFEGTCAPQFSLAEGEFCRALQYGCGDGLICLDNACEPYTISAEGEECDILFGIPCEAGLTCTDIDDTTFRGTCGEPRVAGESCVTDIECGTGTFCEGGACAVLRQNGEPCGDRDVELEIGGPGYVCESTFCELPNPDAEMGTCKEPGTYCAL